MQPPRQVVRHPSAARIRLGAGNGWHNSRASAFFLERDLCRGAGRRPCGLRFWTDRGRDLAAHILTPLQTATLIVGYGLIVQGYAVWKLRQALEL